MRFKSGKMIALESSGWAMLVIDSFTYEGEEFALAKRFDRDERAYRICQWDERENAVKLLEDPELIMYLTLEFNKRNPGLMSDGDISRRKRKKTDGENRKEYFDPSFIGLVENDAMRGISDVKQMMDMISDLDSVKNFEADDMEKKMLLEILASVFCVDISIMDISEHRADPVISLLLRIGTGSEEYIDSYIENTLFKIPDLETDFPHITDAIKKQDNSRFTVACRFIEAELKRYQALTARDALFYNNSRDVLKTRDIVRKGLVVKSELVSERGKGSCKEFIREWTPDKIVEYLDKYIVGQSEAKKAAALTLYRHAAAQAYPDKHLKKENLLIYGPSGCGKTEIFRVLKDISPVPLHMRSASEVTANGYSGTDFDELVLSVSRSDQELSKSIIVLDEIDKLITPEYDSNGENTNKSIQGDLLKIVVGTVISKSRRRVDTANITFIFVGAFAELYEKKIQPCKPIGFGADATVSSDDDIYFSVSDFIKFGMIPELARRISAYIPVRKLTSSDYRKIFTDIRNSIFEEASQFLSINNMRAELESDELIDDLATSAESLELGASGLRSIFSQAVNSRYYEAIRHGIPDEHETVLTIRKEDIQDAALHFEKRCKK